MHIYRTSIRLAFLITHLGEGRPTPPTRPRHSSHGVPHSVGTGQSRSRLARLPATKGERVSWWWWWWWGGWIRVRSMCTIIKLGLTGLALNPWSSTFATALTAAVEVVGVGGADDGEEVVAHGASVEGGVYPFTANSVGLVYALLEEGASLRNLASTRYCFTSKLYCGSPSAFCCPPPPAKPTLLQYACTTIAQYTPPPPTPPLYAIHHTMLVMAISCKG